MAETRLKEAEAQSRAHADLLGGLRRNVAERQRDASQAAMARAGFVSRRDMLQNELKTIDGEGQAAAAALKELSTQLEATDAEEQRARERRNAVDHRSEGGQRRTGAARRKRARAGHTDRKYAGQTRSARHARTEGAALAQRATHAESAPGRRTAGTAGRHGGCGRYPPPRAAGRARAGRLLLPDRICGRRARGDGTAAHEERGADDVPLHHGFQRPQRARNHAARGHAGNRTLRAEWPIPQPGAGAFSGTRCDR